MFRALRLTFALLLGLPSVVPTAWSAEDIPDVDSWTSDFEFEKDDLTSTGRNPFFILEPGYQLALEGGGNRLTITVLNETKVVDGVETRVVEERESEDGELVEVSRNYFAISKRTNSVYYFGEEVDDYEGNAIKSHAGAWLSGVKGARFGLIMPGQILLKARYYQEIAPNSALDRAEIVSARETIKTPAGEFNNCLKTKETTPLEPRAVEYKYYAAGIGLVQEESLKLTKYGQQDESKR
jgi:hypothetical protein